MSLCDQFDAGEFGPSWQKERRWHKAASPCAGATGELNGLYDENLTPSLQAGSGRQDRLTGERLAVGELEAHFAIRD
jgi:hypothetical protein